MKRMSLYDNPKYYEIAFSFRNIPAEVNYFEAAVKKFSKIKVRKVLELASGNSPYLQEWHQRGYEYFGLDLNGRMLDFVKARAKVEGIGVKLFRANMNKFSLGKLKVDLAYVLLGSLFAKSNEDFFQHLDCVGKTLKTGGLYILDGVVWFNLLGDNEQQWTISKNGIKMKVSFRATIIDHTAQTFRDNVVLEISDHGVKKRIRSHELRKFYFPQEFVSLIKCHNQFEFLGYFNDFDLKKPATVKGRQIAVLRKK